MLCNFDYSCTDYASLLSDYCTKLGSTNAMRQPIETERVASHLSVRTHVYISPESGSTKQRLEFVHTGFYSSASVSMRARISVHDSYSFVVVIVKGMDGRDKWVDDIWLRLITTIMHFVR